MNHERLTIIRYRTQRAREAIDEAQLLIQTGHLATAVSRLYYACFYAVNALLLTEGMARSKHGGVMALFDQYWMKTGRLPGDMGRLYHKLFDMRQEGDYGDLPAFQRQEVDVWLAQARQFVDAIAAKIGTTSGSGP